MGVGWNYVEYEALGEDFHTRGKRIEEQIMLLRALWTEPVIDFQSHWHRVPEAGINPLPVQRPIPIWIGGSSDPVLRRTAQMADGWLPQSKPDDTARQTLEKLRNYVQEAGRDPSTIGIEARLNLREQNPDAWRALVQGWQELGASYIGVNTMGMGLESPRAHIEMIEKVWRELL